MPACAACRAHSTRPERRERLGVELDRDRRLGHRDPALAEPGDVHVAVVRHAGIETATPRAGRSTGTGRCRSRGRRARRARARGGSRGCRGSGWRSDTPPSPIVKALSIARPSNQWRRDPPGSSSAGVTRTSVPASQSGSSPSTGGSRRVDLLVEALKPTAGSAAVSVSVVIACLPRMVHMNGSDHTVYFGLLQEPRLTPTSFIVLGLIELSGEATPYDLKQAVGRSLGNFWSLQHAQLYSEPERLAEAGYLKERREEGGRRRRHYSLTAEGPQGAGGVARDARRARSPSCATWACSSSSSAPTPPSWRRPSSRRTGASSPSTRGSSSRPGDEPRGPVAGARGRHRPRARVGRVLGGAAHEAAPSAARLPPWPPPPSRARPSCRCPAAARAPR